MPCALGIAVITEMPQADNGQSREKGLSAGLLKKALLPVNMWVVYVGFF
jgi:hypothetical protein